MYQALSWLPPELLLISLTAIATHLVTLAQTMMHHRLGRPTCLVLS